VIKTTNIASNLIRGCLARHTSKAIPPFLSVVLWLAYNKKKEKKRKGKKKKGKKKDRKKCIANHSNPFSLKGY